MTNDTTSQGDRLPYTGATRGTPADALAQPTRRRIAEVLARNPGGMTPAELADAVGLHHNAVRRHLEVLARAGVVRSERDAAAGRPGRPSRRYLLVADEGIAEAGHRELVRLLVELVRRTGAREEDVESFGRDEGLLLGRDLDGTAGVIGTLAGLGFSPDDVTEDAARRRGERDVVLRRCPFADAVLADGGHLVCALHRGLTLGVLDAAVPDAHLAGFEVRDPVDAGCRIRVRGVPAD